jgi:hypothetical protein
VDAQEATIHNLSDNTAPVYCQHNGAMSNSGPAARLLHLQALHQWQHCYMSTYGYLPGPANSMSDECRRRWDLTDSQLLRHFNYVFPYTRPWRLCQLSNQTHSALILAFLMSESGRLLPANGSMPWTSIGDDGKNSAWSAMRTHICKLWMILSQLSKSLVNDIMVVDSPPCGTPLNFA